MFLVGHKIHECHNKKAAEEKAKVAFIEEKELLNVQVEFAFDCISWVGHDHVCTIDGETFFVFTENTWIGGTGASSHITNDDDGMFDEETINKTVHGSSGMIKAAKLEIVKIQIQ